MKYISYESVFDDIIIFPDFHNHDDMADVIGIAKDKILGAGFVTSTMECYGKSVSLGVKSRGDLDTKLLDKFFDN